MKKVNRFRYAFGLTELKLQEVNELIDSYVKTLESSGERKEKLPAKNVYEFIVKCINDLEEKAIDICKNSSK